MAEKPETETYTCGHCLRPVLTFWAPDGGGLIRGEYELLGDVIFHRACCDEYLKDFPS